MAKLPPDFVKAPVFDHPLRATVAKVEAEARAKVREIVLRVDEKLWAALEKACAAEGTTPVELVLRIVSEHLAARDRPPQPAVGAAEAAQVPPLGNLADEVRAPSPGAAAAAAAERHGEAGFISELVELILTHLKRLGQRFATGTSR